MYIPYILVVVAGLVWGGTFSLTLIATEGGVHPLVLATLQVIITAPMFVGICIATRKRPFVFANLKYYCVLALLGISVPNLLYYAAAPSLNAGILSITISTVPMLTYLVMWLGRFEDFELRRFSGIILGMLAIVLLVVPDQPFMSSDAGFWILVVLVCALCYALENVFIGEGLGDSISVRELLAGSNTIAALILLPILAVMDLQFDRVWLFGQTGLAIFGIALSSTLAYMMFFYCIRISGPVFASQCAYVVTISGVLWGIALFAERHSLWTWAAVVAMLVGLFLVTPKNRSGSPVVAAPQVGANPRR